MTDNTRRLLDLYTDYLLVSFGQATATGLAALLPDVVSHDKVTRFLANNEFGSKDLWKVVKPHVRKIQRQEAVLIFDDTIEEKPYTDENEIINWHFDHTQNRTVKGVNLLTALYHSHEVSLPVDFEEEYHKSIKSIKSCAAFSKSPTRRVRTQSNHFFASLVAFVKLEAYRTGLTVNHFALRGKFYQAAVAKAFEQLQILKVLCPNAAIIF